MFYKLLFILSFVVHSKNVDFFKDNCVAWKTKKKMFLVKRLEPVGMSCEAKASVEKGDKPYLKVEVPISSFDSGERKRDKEVLKILQAGKQKNLIFKSVEALKIYNSKKSLNMSVSGFLVIAGEEFVVNFNVSKLKKDNKIYYTGKSILKYTDLKIKPPSVAGGAVAKVKDYLELHFRFSEESVINNIF